MMSSSSEDIQSVSLYTGFGVGNFGGGCCSVVYGHFSLVKRGLAACKSTCCEWSFNIVDCWLVFDSF